MINYEINLYFFIFFNFFKQTAFTAAGYTGNITFGDTDGK